MSTVRNFLLAITVTIPSALVADQWSAPRQDRINSSNGNFYLAIKPHDDPETHPNNCRATLFHRANGKRTERWSRFLVNEVAPVMAFVSNQGKFVVTLNEWYFVGTHPVVLYDVNGAVVHEHTIKTLGIRDADLKLDRSFSGIWWNANAVAFFSQDESVFFIRLKTQQVLVIKLATGDTVPFDSLSNKQTQFYGEQLRKIAKRYVRSGDPALRQTGAIICGQELLVSQKLALRDLLSDTSFFLMGRGSRTRWTREFYVRKAARDALKAMGESHDDVVVSRTFDPK